MYGFSLKEQKEWQEKQEEAPENPMGPYNVGRPGGLYHQMLETIIPAGLGAFSGIRENRTKDMRIYTTGFSRP